MERTPGEVRASLTCASPFCKTLDANWPPSRHELAARDPGVPPHGLEAHATRASFFQSYSSDRELSLLDGRSTPPNPPSQEFLP